MKYPIFGILIHKKGYFQGVTTKKPDQMAGLSAI